MKYLILTLFSFATLWLLIAPTVAESSAVDSTTPKGAEYAQEQILHRQVRTFLEKKHSPLASHVTVLLQQKHWQLIIAISAIESSYCLHAIGNNCWGIKGGENYRSYSSLDTAIPDVEKLIALRQSQGKWLTVESMNGSYVVPRNPNWVYVVNKTITQLKALSYAH